jgi:hypothetical protein
MAIGSLKADKDYAISIKKIRNQMRCFSYLSVLDALLAYLNAPLLADKTEELRRLPWVAERLMLLLLRDEPQMYKATKATEFDIQAFINSAWNAADTGYGTDQKIKQLGLFVRQHMLPQMPYQRQLDTHAFALQLYLVQQLADNSKLKIFLDERAGMAIGEYYEMAFIYWAHTLGHKPWFNARYVEVLAPAFAIKKQEIFLKSLTTPLNDLQLLCRKRSIVIDEWFQPTYFYKTPCIAHQDAIVPIGRPTLRRYFESLAIDWIEESERTDLRQSYDQLIERYVAESLKRAQLNFLTEAELKKVQPTQQTSDFAIEEGETIVLLEVKNKWLSNSIPASRNPYELKSKLKQTIVKGKTQLEDTEKALSNLPYYKNKKFFRVIVTTNDLWISNAEILLEEADADRFTWLVSLQDLDMLCEILSCKTKSLQSIFNEYEQGQKNPMISTYSFGKFLDGLNEKTNKLPKHLLKLADALVDKIGSKLVE